MRTMCPLVWACFASSSGELMAHLISRPSSALEVMAAAPMGATRAEVVVVVPAVASEDMVNVLICLRACDEKETHNYKATTRQKEFWSQVAYGLDAVKQDWKNNERSKRARANDNSSDGRTSTSNRRSLLVTSRRASILTRRNLYLPIYICLCPSSTTS